MAFKSKNKSIIKYLIDQGADVNGKMEYNVSALIKACEYGYTDIVKYLIEHGANINEKKENGKSAIMTACKYGNEDIVKYLI